MSSRLYATALLLAITAPITVPSAFADLNVTCRVGEAGREVGSCSVRISSSEGTGEAKIAPGAEYRLSADPKCPIKDYDLIILNKSAPLRSPGENASQIDRLEYQAQLVYHRDTFGFAIVNYKKGNRSKPKTKNQMDLTDFGFGSVTGSLNYSANGSGLLCSIKN